MKLTKVKVYVFLTRKPLEKEMFQLYTSSVIASEKLQNDITHELQRLAGADRLENITQAVR